MKIPVKIEASLACASFAHLVIEKRSSKDLSYDHCDSHSYEYPTSWANPLTDRSDVLLVHCYLSTPISMEEVRSILPVS